MGIGSWLRFDLDKRKWHSDNVAMLLLRESALSSVLANPVCIAAVFSWFSSQLIKAGIALTGTLRGRRGNPVRTMFWSTGGMPSSHAAVVCSLCVAIAFREGVDSSLFILSLFLALIVLRDALGVRRSAGEQAAKLNDLIDRLNQEHGNVMQKVAEVKGHTPIEVCAGILLGIAWGVIVSVA